MKTPVVTVMRTQGARRRHQQAVESKKLAKWLEEQKRWLAEMEEKNRQSRIDHARFMSDLSERICRGV